MEDPSIEIDASPEIAVALAYARSSARPLFQAVFDLDRNLGRAVAVASEPIVGQIRLAWWRDALSSTPADQPRGNPLLDQIKGQFGGSPSGLTQLVDGWEAMLLSDPGENEAIRALCTGRAQAFIAIAHQIGATDTDEAVSFAAERWSLADLAARCSDKDRRSAIVAFSRSCEGEKARVTRSMRPLAVLRALGERSLARDGAPLLADRISALVALRSGLSGR